MLKPSQNLAGLAARFKAEATKNFFNFPVNPAMYPAKNWLDMRPDSLHKIFHQFFFLFPLKLHTHQGFKGSGHRNVQSWSITLDTHNHTLAYIYIYIGVFNRSTWNTNQNIQIPLGITITKEFKPKTTITSSTLFSKIHGPKILFPVRKTKVTGVSFRPMRYQKSSSQKHNFHF